MARGKDRATYVLELIDRITAPARRILGPTNAMRKATDAAKTSAEAANTAMAGFGTATERAAAKVSKSAQQMRRAAGQMRVATQSSSWANVRPGFAVARNTGVAGSWAGGRKLVGRGPVARAGPVLDRSAQGAAAGGMGPVLNRKAQNLGFVDRMNVATKGMRDWNTTAGKTLEQWGDMRAAFMKTPFGMAARGLGSVALGVGTIAVQAAVAVVELLLLA